MRPQPKFVHVEKQIPTDESESDDGDRAAYEPSIEDPEFVSHERSLVGVQIPR